MARVRTAITRNSLNSWGRREHRQLFPTNRVARDETANFLSQPFRKKCVPSTLGYLMIYNFNRFLYIVIVINFTIPDGNSGPSLHGHYKGVQENLLSHKR